MESKKGGGVLLVLEEVRLGNRLFFFLFQFYISQLAERVQTSNQKFVAFKKYIGTGLKQKCCHREIGTHGWTLLLSEEQ